MGRTVLTDSGEPVKSVENFAMNPFDVIVTEAISARGEQPSDEMVQKIAESFASIGQIHNILVRAMPDKKAELIAGHTKTLAAQMVRTGFMGSDGVWVHLPEFKIGVSYAPNGTDDDTALAMAIAENTLRSDPSPIGRAKTVEKLIGRGWNGKKIAKALNIDEATVTRAKKILKATEEEQAAVAAGTMKESYLVAAVDAEEDAEKRAELHKAAQEKAGKEAPAVTVLNTVVADRDRAARKAQKETANTPPATTENAETPTDGVSDTDTITTDTGIVVPVPTQDLPAPKKPAKALVKAEWATLLSYLDTVEGLHGLVSTLWSVDAREIDYEECGRQLQRVVGVKRSKKDAE